MTIASIADQLSPVQRLMYRQAPDAGFFAAFKSAYADYATAAGDTAQVSQASSEPSAPDRLLAELLGQTHTELSARRGVSQDDQAAYAAILDRAYREGAMADPVGFLRGLSREDLAVVQRNHCLAQAIDPNVLSREGAYNLLLPEGYGVDFNKDDLLEVGIARSVQFPPVDAPEAFVKDWFAATEGMSEMDAATYGLVMFTAMHTLPIGDQALVRRMATDDVDSYRRVVADYLAMLERFQGQLPDGQYERDKSFFTRLQTLLG